MAVKDEGEGAAQVPAWTAAVDLGALLAEVARAPDELTKAWSRALDTATLEAGIEQLKSRLQAAFTAYQGTIAAQDAERDAPTRLAEFPLSDSSLNAVAANEGGNVEHGMTAQMVVL